MQTRQVVPAVTSTLVAVLAGGLAVVGARGAAHGQTLSGHVAFDLAIQNRRELGIMTATGTGLRTFAFGALSGSDPSLSPSGTQIVFVLDGLSGTHLARMTPGAELAVLTSGRMNDTAPAWSPNGRTIAFVRNGGGRQRALCLINPAERPRLRCPARGALGGPAWSPNSAQLAFCARGGLFALSLSPIRVHVLARLVCQGAPAWSPDGKTIVVTRNVNGSAQLFAVDAGTGTSRQLLSDAANDSEPAYSPDGAWIAFTSDRGGYDALYRVSADGRQTLRLSPPGYDGANPSWSR
ncbi:MAG TPA: hypothetical protein VFA05_07005 [Gaiellaceae bacterium]|nr:hypothetical protein [Gaiellaceae bacterium]